MTRRRVGCVLGVAVLVWPVLLAWGALFLGDTWTR